MKVSSFRPTASEERWKSGYEAQLNVRLGAETMFPMPCEVFALFGRNGD